MAAAFIVSPEQTMRYRKGIASFHKKCKEKPYKIRWLDTPSQDARFCNDFRENVTL
ncbi:hypothetical protein DESPIG_00475 [Desulfovibrio piger ATCC 29098]|uniref:Uncharacterized protein n=1 Tax=Desulfovibrio piger ATCC 29098 TaxID=411464 RepID=B6WQZ4_9BACT|nr:hypothetical protein DESPIG_00475 [Desulfovibrio piger ATCC 29098]